MNDPSYRVMFMQDGSPCRIEPDLEENELTALGYVTAQWGFLEHALFTETLNLAEKGLVEPPLDASSTSFTKRLKAWRLLVEAVVTDTVEKKRLLKLASRIANAENKRHQITHGVWTWSLRSPHRVTAFSFRPKVAFSEPYDFYKIIQLGILIGEIGFELIYSGGREEAWEAMTGQHAPAYVSRSFRLHLMKNPSSPRRPPISLRVRKRPPKPKE
jgi:hypothetical protein